MAPTMMNNALIFAETYEKSATNNSSLSNELIRPGVSETMKVLLSAVDDINSLINDAFFL
jgi:hypothetical protein